MTDQRATHYRADIDGLRCLAIMPILLLHCGLTGLRGGFIGVDIFFVISGYLITGIIVRELDHGTFSLTQFYRRRIVRILPALAVMTAATLLMGCLILLPNPLRDLGHSAAAVSVFASNVYFYATGDYFAQASELKPLIHTWSLAVEEQFYLFFPLLLLALRKLDRKRLVITLCAIGFASFAIGGWMAMYKATAGYFLLPARIWELVLGALVALGFYPRLAAGKVRSALCWLAIAGILLCTIVTGSGWPFPVPFALPPAAAAAFLLAYAPGTPAASLLSARLPRAIGLISYSLYLWHRPIVAFYLAGRSFTFGWQATLLLLSLTFLAAMASYWLIEQPAQRLWRKGTGLKPHLCAAIGIAAFAACGLAIAANAERIRPLPSQVTFVASYLGFEASPAGKRQFGGACFVIPTGKDYDPSCMAPAKDRPNILLVGDSHAAQLSGAMRQVLAHAHLLQATAAGCRPLLVGQGLRRCRAIVEAAFHDTDSARIGTIVLAGRWFQADAQPLADTIRFLKGRGFKVIVVGPVVEYDADVPEILARAMLAGKPEGILALRTLEREQLDHQLAPIVNRAGARYLSYLPIECPAGQCRLFTATGAPLHMDQSHVTPEIAKEMASAIVRTIQR